MSEAEIAALHGSDPTVGQTAQPLDSPGTLPQPTLPAMETGAPPGDDGTVDPSPAPAHDRNPDGDASALSIDRLEKLARQQRRQSLLSGVILVMLGVLLAAQVFVLVRPQPLDLRD